MPENKTDIFNTLQSINCNDHVEKKNGLSYLSWAWAWGIAKQFYPKSYYTIYENEDHWNYHNDGKTGWVKTGVTIVDGDYELEHIEYLPIMDFRNSSIPLKDIKSFDVNKAIQRSLTKALARHGLGLYIYAGEDLPAESEQDKKAREEEERMLHEQVEDLQRKISAEIVKATKTMNDDQKMTFANETIIPIIGFVNYRKCQDVDKLNQLLVKLNPAA